MKTFMEKNKAQLILPLVLLPFVILIFYILGGGEKTTGTASKNAEMISTDGVNYQLPEAESSIEIFDKMEAYSQNMARTSTRDYNILGETDSVQYNTLSGEIPYDSVYSRHTGTLTANADVSSGLLSHILQKEASIRKELEGGAKETENNYPKNSNFTMSSGNKKSEDSRGQGETETPEQIQTRFTGFAELDKVFDENIILNRENDSLKFYLQQASIRLSEIETEKKNQFTVGKKEASAFGKNTEKENTLIRAEIYESVNVLDGNRVKLRLLEDVRINGLELSENSFVYGICKISNERLLIQITQLPVQNSFLPVNLAIYDLDGLPGLYVPDNAARKVAKEVGSSTNTSSMFGVASDPLAYAGIRAADRTAQTLLKNVRLKRVTVKKNTLVYLINQKQ
jgi:hypothetical protein